MRELAFACLLAVACGGNSFTGKESAAGLSGDAGASAGASGGGAQGGSGGAAGTLTGDGGSGSTAGLGSAGQAGDAGAGAAAGSIASGGGAGAAGGAGSCHEPRCATASGQPLCGTQTGDCGTAVDCSVRLKCDGSRLLADGSWSSADPSQTICGTVTDGCGSVTSCGDSCPTGGECDTARNLCTCWKETAEAAASAPCQAGLLNYACRVVTGGSGPTPKPTISGCYANAGDISGARWCCPG
jgi:hypothetical protein